MFLWKYMAIIFVFGAIGGVVNALLSDNGFILPRKEEQNNNRIIRPGFLVNILSAELLLSFPGAYTGRLQRSLLSVERLILMLVAQD